MGGGSVTLPEECPGMPPGHTRAVNGDGPTVAEFLAEFNFYIAKTNFFC